jgi:hypothetical protein
LTSNSIPHDIGGILNSKGGLWLSNSGLLKYQAVVRRNRDNFKNLSKPIPGFPPMEEEGEGEHSCESDAAQPDQPLDNPDLELHTDGSSFARNGVRHAEFAVVTE